jgi:hypothetical protein
VEAEQVVVNNVEFGSAQNGLYVTTSSGSSTGSYPYDLSNTPALVSVTDLRVDSTLGDAIYVNAVESTFDSVSVSQTSGAGFDLVGSATVSYSNVDQGAQGVTATGSLTLLGDTFGTTTGTGVNFYGDTLTADGVTIQAAGTYGITGTGTTLSVTDSTLTSTWDALHLDGSSITVSGVTGLSSTGNGLYAADGTLDATSNIFSGNAEYGMECSSTTINSCNSNDLTGNILGDQSGCSETCGS